MEKMNISGIKPADVYAKEEQERLKLAISNKSYRELREMLGVAEKEEQQRAHIRAEKAKKRASEPESPKLDPPLRYNYDYPHME